MFPRACLEPIWQWISRDLMASETKAYSDQIARVLLTNDKPTSERLARAFQDQAVQRIQQALNAVQDDAKARQRLAAQVGTPHALDDLRTVFGVLKARDALNVFASRLPASIKNLADDQLDNVKALLNSPVGGHPDVFLYALILVMGRLAVPCQLVRLAIKAAETDQASRVAGTPYALCVTIVLEEMERVLVRAAGERQERPATARSAASSRTFTTRRASCAPRWISPATRRGRASLRRCAPRSPT